METHFYVWLYFNVYHEHQKSEFYVCFVFCGQELNRFAIIGRLRKRWMEWYDKRLEQGCLTFFKHLTPYSKFNICSTLYFFFLGK